MSYSVGEKSPLHTDAIATPAERERLESVADFPLASTMWLEQSCSWSIHISRERKMQTARSLNDYPVSLANLLGSACPCPSSHTPGLVQG